MKTDAATSIASPTKVELEQQLAGMTTNLEIVMTFLKGMAFDPKGDMDAFFKALKYLTGIRDALHEEIDKLNKQINAF
jgi:hypothetical protein